MTRNHVLALAVFVFLVAFLTKMEPILHSHTCWCDFRNPDGFSEVIQPIIYGLLAIGSALGLNIKDLFKKESDK